MGGRTSVSKVEDTNNEDDNGETRTDSDDPPNNKVTPFHDEDDTEQRQDKTAEDGEPVLIITEDNTFQNTPIIRVHHLRWNKIQKRHL